MTTQINGTTGLTFSDSSVQNTAAIGFRNRIINGGMTIDQRNGGGNSTAIGYTVDRWGYYATQTAKGTWGQNFNAVTPPAGFKNYLGFQTGGSSYSVISTDLFEFYQSIEGYNLADLGWGAAGAATVTLSFWVRSSLTGTFGGSLTNNGNTRNYPFTYTISAANTWEQKSVTVAGDTTGTWLTTNGVGMVVIFSMGAGSSYNGTANAWNGTTSAIIPTGATSVVGTANATFFITGVQLEKATTASSFDFRSFGQELALCQRYYEKSYDITTPPGTNTATGSINNYGSSDGTNNQVTSRPFMVSKRTTPTTNFYTQTGTPNQWDYFRSGGSGTTTMTNYFACATSWSGYISVGVSWASCYSYGHWVSSAEL